MWSPTVGEIVSVDREEENAHNRHAVCLLKAGAIIGWWNNHFVKLQEKKSMEKA